MTLHLLGVTAEGEALVLELVGRIEKCRELLPEESDLIAELIRREKRRKTRRFHVWTPDEDRELLRVQHRHRGIIRAAAVMGVSEKAAWRRLDKLRNQKRGTTTGRKGRLPSDTSEAP